MGEPTILAALEVASNGKGVRVEFTRVDRVISHTIFLVNGGEKSAVMTSQINSPGQPCFTELYQQGDMLFLTGADGPCHWSMSVSKGEIPFGSENGPNDEILELFEQRYGLNAPHHATSTVQSIHFDIACRVKNAVDNLHSEYQIKDHLDSIILGKESSCAGLLLMKDHNFFHLGSNTEIGGATSQLAPCCVLKMNGSQLRISSPQRLANQFPVTARWSYTVALIQ